MAEITVSSGEPDGHDATTSDSITVWLQLSDVGCTDVCVLEAEMAPSGLGFRLKLRRAYVPIDDVEGELIEMSRRLLYQASNRELMELIVSGRLRQLQA